MISFQQQKRIAKVFTDPLYFLQYQHHVDNNQVAWWKIAGSTRNVYTITLYNDGKMWCDCPDMTTYSQRYKCVCKHIAFVGLKVLKYPLSQLSETFLQTLQWTNDDIAIILDKMYDTIDRTVIDDNLIQRFKGLAVDKKDTTSNVRHIEEDDDCPICYDLLTNSKQLYACNTCGKSVHDECIKKWFTLQNTCVYCRTPQTTTHESKYIKL